MGRQTSRPVHLLPARRRALPGGWQNCLTYRDGAHALAQRANVFPGFAAALRDHAVICCPAAQGVLWDEDVKVPRKGGLATFAHISLAIRAQRQSCVFKAFSSDG